MIGQIIVPHIYKETSTYTDRDTDGAFTPSICHEMKGKKWEQWQIFFCWSTKSLHMVTAAMKLKKKKKKKKHLLLGRRATTNLDNIFKSRDITLPAKVHIVHQFFERIDAFELWCWRRLLWVPWIARSINLIKKEINPEYSLKGLFLKVKLQYLGHWCRESTHWGENPYAGKD